MNWITLNSEEQLRQLNDDSSEKPQIIYKHSTRCSISTIVKNRIDRNNPPEGVDFYFLDIINHRQISNKIANDYDIHHESPQLLIIRDGKCIYDESHTSIHMDEVESVLNNKIA
jgi:bacillithiol system protein YtxJ